MEDGLSLEILVKRGSILKSYNPKSFIGGRPAISTWYWLVACLHFLLFFRPSPVQHIFIFHLFNGPCLVFAGVCSFLQEDNCLLMISRRNILLFTFTSSLSEETSKRLVTPTKLTFISNFQNKRNSARQLKIGAYTSTVSKNGFHSKLICPPFLPPREKKSCVWLICHLFFPNTAVFHWILAQMLRKH